MVTSARRSAVSCAWMGLQGGEGMRLRAAADGNLRFDPRQPARPETGRKDARDGDVDHCGDNIDGPAAERHPGSVVRWRVCNIIRPQPSRLRRYHRSHQENVA